MRGKIESERDMRDVKYSLEWLLKTKADIMKMLEKSRVDLDQAKLDVGVWEMMVNDVDAEIAEIQAKQRALKQASGRARIGIIFITFLVLASILLSGCHFISGCGTAIQGLGTDITQASDGYMDNINK